jgi:DNA adenine methylase
MPLLGGCAPIFLPEGTKIVLNFKMGKMNPKGYFKIEFKTPITYYGGKQKMLPYILPLIPEHKIYIEPFFGGGAVFWAKEPAKIEFINDSNSEVINFYRVLKFRFPELKKEIEATLHSEFQQKQARQIYLKDMTK